MTDQNLHYDAVETARLSERLIFLTNRPGVIILFALVTVFLAYQAYHLKPDASFNKLIPQQHQFIQKMNDHMRDLRASGASLKVSVAARQGDIFNDEYLTTLGQIADEMEREQEQ